jgi:4-amino-4-deoxy-L-arabinose transferase-like glycosyltransferase
MKKTRIIDFLLCFIVFILVIITTKKYGPGVSADSAAYLNAAKSLAAGHGLQYFAYTSPFMQWPPLYPILLSIPVLLHQSVLEFSRYMNALFLVLALFFTVSLLRKKLKTKIAPYVFLLLCITAFPLLNISLYIWSEPVFVFLMAIVFYILFTSELRKNWLKPVLLMGIVSALACLARYVGVTVVAAVALYLLFAVSGIGNKIKAVILYGSISVLPTCAFIIRNYILSQTRPNTVYCSFYFP